MTLHSAQAAEVPGRGVRGRTFTVGAYIVVAFLYWIALYLYAPTLPTYVRSKSDTLSDVGLVLSMYGLWMGLIRLPSGMLSDWLGRRKPFIIAGLGLTGFGAWLLAAATGVHSLLVAQAVTGAACLTWVVLVVSFSSLFAPEEAVRAAAGLTLVGSLARTLATAANGVLNELGGYTLAFYLAVGSSLLGMLVMLPVREVRRPRPRYSLLNLTRVITRRSVVLPALLSAVLQFANFATTWAFIPVLASQLGATDFALGLLASTSMALAMFGNLTATAIVKHAGASRLALLSYLALFMGIGGAAIASRLPLVYVTQALVGLAVGLGAPVLMGLSIQSVADEQRSTAMGLHQSVYAFGMFAGPWLSGILADSVGIRLTFGFVAIASAALGVLGIRGLKTTSQGSDVAVDRDHQSAAAGLAGVSERSSE